LQLLTLLGSAIVLVSVFGSRDVRIQLKQIIAKNFFSHRFDYRAEWRRFVDTVSQSSAGEDYLSARVVRALAQIVDSPAGTLWGLRQGGWYAPEIGWNMQAARGQRLDADHPFIGDFRGGAWIQERSRVMQANWPADLAESWLAIPLLHANEIIAFVALASPAHLYSPDWETFDLLRVAGSQAASYLVEERSTRALLDSQVLTDYSKRFAFVIHDIKNLASQLGMVVANARRYIANPEFQQDMLNTVQDSVAQMNRLLAQLRAGNLSAVPQVIEPDLVVAALARDLSAAGIVVETRLGASGCVVAIDGDHFRSALSHLISNANEATQPERAVVVTSRSTKDKIVIDVVDSGEGMDEKFVREDLFHPFRSTKSGGLGIGAYQTREMLRMCGADLDVISQKGVGTIMRITLPEHRKADEASSAA
jgi:putative PEP-CTERM system histidine kinase